jgi:PASTA domain
VRRRHAIGAGVAVSAAIMLTGAGAQAATVTIGSQFTTPPNGSAAYQTATLFNRALPAPANATSPVDGTVISWRFIGSGAGPMVPRIVRPVGADTFTGAGTGPGQTPAGLSTISGPFPLSLPIRRGDFFGVNIPQGQSIAYRDMFIGRAGAALFPPLSDGGAARSVNPGDNYPDEEEAIGAIIRYCLVPNLKGKKPKAARRALAAADCTAGKAKKSKKRRKKKKVLSQTVAPGTSISDTAPVGFKVSKPKK